MWFVSDDISIKSTRTNTKITDCIDDTHSHITSHDPHIIAH